jgi:apolipoprotein N-acyltransferase
VAAGVALLAATERRWRTAGLLLAAPLALAALGWVAPDGRTTGEPLDVAIVQGGGPRGFRAVDSDPRDVLEAHLAVSERLERDDRLDLVLWPENTIDVDDIDGSEEAALLSELAERLDTTVVAGVTEDATRDRFQNVAVAWSPEGRIVDRYVKVHRVPFGEYVPLRGLLERVVDLSVLPRDAVAGTGDGLVRTPAGDFGVAISYEVFFGDRARVATNAGGQLLLVPTNAASFTTSQVPTQEVAAAQLRAWETGRWVLMSAPTGYGAVVDHQGRLLDRTTLSRAEVLEGTVELREGRTIASVVGDLPVVLLAAVALVVLTRRRATAPTSAGPTP